jgi:hypothetical protein
MPIRGVTTIFARASDAIAPRGKGSPDRTRKQARALPRHIRPIGTHAAPTKVAVSRTKASGGCPSGAMGRKRGLKLDDGGRKSALSGSTSAITIANTITIGQGLSNSFKICGERGTRWSQREERGSVGCRRSSGRLLSLWVFSDLCFRFGSRSHRNRPCPFFQIRPLPQHRGFYRDVQRTA